METFKCIRCGKTVKKLHEEISERHSRTPPPSDMWDSAGVHEFIPGYGSKHDMTRYVVAICDYCIDDLVADGSLVEIGWNE